MSAFRIPADLWLRAASLSDLGVEEFAWRPADAVQLLDLLRTSTIAVLGGDVYTRSAGRFHPAYENWYVEQDPLEEPASYAARSHAIASNYFAGLQQADGADEKWVTLVSSEPIEQAEHRPR